MNIQKVLTGIIIEETTVFSLEELSQACGRPSEWVLELVEQGVIDPDGANQGQWRFSGDCLRRVLIIHRLIADLGANLAGAALALELLEELEQLRNRLAALDR